MSAAMYELKASCAFIERNINIVKRYWAWEVVWLVYSIVNSLSVSYIGVGMEKLGGQGIDSHFLVLCLAVGTIVWRYLTVIFYWVTDVIGIERWEGTIEYTLMAPIQRITHMLGQTSFAVVYSLVHTGVILAATALFFNLSLARANLLGATLMLITRSRAGHQLKQSPPSAWRKVDVNDLDLAALQLDAIHQIDVGQV